MATRLIAVLLVALSLVPVANLLPGGEHDPGYAERMLDWLNGLALCLGAGVLVAFIVRTRDPGRRAITLDNTGAPAWPPGVGGSFIALAALGAFALYAIIAQSVFAGRPLLIDEVVQVMQARWLTEGRLWVEPARLREFFSILHVVDVGDRVFGQFPVGGPAMLALGSLMRAEWLVGPAAGAACVALFARSLPVLEPGATRLWWRGTTILFALTPFGVFMFGSHMNHATTLAWLLLATLALARATSTHTRATTWGFVTGLALGMAATIRPLDAVAFALPAGAWLAWRARAGGRDLRTLLWSGVGVAIPLALLLVANSRTTGSALVFGYDQLWGSSHAIGFHEAPWGPPHTPARGFELVSLYFTRLSTYLFESPFPAVLLVAAGLWLSPRLAALDRYLLVSSGLIVVGYWAYWHDGFFLGPRFYFPLLPVAVLWTARLPVYLRALVGRDGLAWVALRTAAVVAVAMALVTLAFVRVPSYRGGLTSMRFDVVRESSRAGVTSALVLVKESWGSRLVVRMWALGVSRTAAERIYRDSDVCRLELTVSALELARSRGEPADAERTLMPLRADSGRLVRSAATGGFTESVLAGATYPQECSALRAMDEQGHSHLAPFLLARDGNVYARWLPGREAEIAALYPGREVYRVVRAGPEPDAALVWQRLESASR